MAGFVDMKPPPVLFILLILLVVGESSKQNEKFSKADVQSRGLIVAEYLSDGDDNLVLTCYLSSFDPDRYTAAIRDTMGRRLKDWFNVDCSLETHQVVYEYQYTREDGTSGLAKYWTQIMLDRPRNCPSMLSTEMILTTEDNDSILTNTKATAVAKYTTSGTPVFVLTCYKVDEAQMNYWGKELMSGHQYLSVVTNSTGGHVVTFTSIDCVSKENFNQKLGVHTTFGDDDMNYIVVGSRWQIDDDWCWYSIYKEDYITGRHKNPLYQTWIYYDYSPSSFSLEWKDVNPNDCPTRLQVVDFKGTKTTATTTTTSYFAGWRENVLLFCHHNALKSVMENVIYDEKGNFLIAFSGVDCSSKRVLDEKSYMMTESVGSNKYLSIGVRSSPKEVWYQYNVCLDCENKEFKYNLASDPTSYRILEWTEAGVRLGVRSPISSSNGVPQGIDPLSPDVEWGPSVLRQGTYSRTMLHQYVTSGKTKIVVSCIALQQEKELKYYMTIRQSNGVHIASVLSDVDCSDTSFKLKFYFIAMMSDGRFKITTDDTCAMYGCVVPPEVGDKEAWLYYSFSRLGFGLESFPKANSCPKIPRENILFDNVVSGKHKKISTYWNRGYPMFKLTCYGKDNNYFAVIANKKDEHILTLKDVVCKTKEDIAQRIYIDTTKAVDTSYVVVGSRGLEDHKWCYYHVRSTGNQKGAVVYYGYEPNELAHQWFEPGDSEHCPSKPEKIVVLIEPNTNTHPTESFDSDTTVKVYVTKFKGEYYALTCHKTIDGKKEVFLRFQSLKDQSRKFSINGLDCSTKDFWNEVYMFLEVQNGNTYLAIGTKTYITKGKKAWCRYDVCWSCDSQTNPEFQINIDAEPRREVFQWSKPGVRIAGTPSFKNMFNPTDEEGNQLKKESLKFLYQSTGFDIEFVLHCFKTGTGPNERYTSVITSLRGLSLGTVQDVDCSQSENLFENAYIYISRGGKHAYSSDLKSIQNTDMKEWFCWYHGCNEQKDSSENVWLFYFFNNKNGKVDQQDVQQNGLGKTNSRRFSMWPTTYDSGSDDEEGHRWGGEYEHYRYYNRHHHSGRNGWSQIHPSQQGFECPNLNRKDISIERSKPDTTGWTLIAKYFRRSHPKFELLCYQQVLNNQFRYLYVISDSNIDYTITISNNNCSPEKMQPKDIINVEIDGTDSSEAKDFVFVGTPSCWYSVCTNCKTPIIGVYHNFKKSDEHNWQQVPMDSCQSLKAQDIYTDQSKITVRQENIVARYTTYRENNMFLLHCYRVSGSNGNKEYITVLRTLQGSHVVSVKGIDCSSSDILQRASYMFVTPTKTEKVLSLGTRDIIGKNTGAWCQYDVHLDSGAIAVAANVIPYRSVLQWSEAAVRIKDCPSPRQTDDLNSNEIVAKFVDKSRKLGVTCFKSTRLNGYTLQLWTSKGFQIVTIPNYGDCSKNDNLIGRFYVHNEMSDNQIKVFGDDHPDIQSEIESCWKTGSDAGGAETRLYYFLGDKFYAYRWQPLGKDANCPSIPRKRITTVNSVRSKMKEYVEYFSGGKRVKLTCYVFKSEYFATISTLMNENVFAILDFNCFSTKNKLLQFYVDNDDQNLIRIGSRNSPDDDWCFYNIFIKSGVIDNIWTDPEYNHETINPQWFKDTNENCPAFKHENILKGDSYASLGTNTLESVSVKEVYAEEYPKDILQAYWFYCHQITEGKIQIYVLVIKTQEGLQVASIKDFDCTQKAEMGLIDNLHVLPLEDDGTSKYVAFVSRRSIGDDWCRYDVCVDCATRDVRVNIDEEVYKRYRWSEVKPPNNDQKWSECPRLVDYAEYQSNKKIEITKYINKEGYIFNCYQAIDSKGNPIQEFASNILDPSGKRIAMLKGFSDCSSRTTRYLNDRLNVKKSNDGAGILIITISRPSTCQYTSSPSYSYIICTDCQGQHTSSFYSSEARFKGEWAKVIADTCYPLNTDNREKSSTTILADLSGYREVATYITVGDKDNELYVLVCYQNDKRFITRLQTLEGQDVYSIRDVDCSSDDNMAKYFMAFVADGSNRYLALGTRGNSEDYPWCDLYLSCGGKEIRFWLNEGKTPVKVLKWSKAGIETDGTSKKACGSKTLVKDNRIAGHVSAVNPKLTVDCYVLSEDPISYCSIIKNDGAELFTSTDTECIIRGRNMKTFYINTIYDSSSYSLLKLDTTKMEVKGVMDQTPFKIRAYYFLNEEWYSNPGVWRQIMNPKLFLTTSDNISKTDKPAVPSSKRKRIKSTILSLFNVKKKA